MEQSYNQRTLEQLLDFADNDLAQGLQIRGGGNNIRRSHHSQDIFTFLYSLASLAREFIDFCSNRILSTRSRDILEYYFSYMLPYLVSDFENMPENEKAELERAFILKFRSRYYLKIQIIKDNYKKFCSQSSQRANTDFLTGLANRGLFEDKINAFYKELIKEGNNKGKDRKTNPIQHTLVYIDLNNLKEINDKYGHSAGDAYIKAVAEWFKKNSRDVEDVIARIGGDEFAIIFYGANANDVEKKLKYSYNDLTQYVNNAIKEALKKEGKTSESNVNISIGITELNSSIDVNSAKQQADKAMYLAKALSKYASKGQDHEDLYNRIQTAGISVCENPTAEQLVQVYNPNLDINESIYDACKQVFQNGR